MPVTYIAAAIAAVAVLLIFFGIFGSRGGDVAERLERYASSSANQPRQREGTRAATPSAR